MTDGRAGHHGDIGYVFEDQGPNSPPNDSTVKAFGSNVVPDTLEGSHEAVRVFNADRKAAEIIEQVFDGSWSVTFDLSTPPWWLAAILGQPSSSSVSGDLYDYTYALSNNNDPVSLRLYAPTDGFSDYEVYAGAVISSVTVNQSVPDSPEVTLTGAYATEPTRQSSPSVSIPDLAESTYSNRHAEVQFDGNTVGKSQSTELSIEANTELVNEIGSANAVDFIPKTFAPDLTMDHIVWVGQTVDMLDKFKSAGQVATKLKFDNGGTGDSKYVVDFSVSGSKANQWSQSGRNDPEADLVDELQNMAEDVSVTVSTAAESTGNPPGITL